MVSMERYIKEYTNINEGIRGWLFKLSNVRSPGSKTTIYSKLGHPPTQSLYITGELMSIF